MSVFLRLVITILIRFKGSTEFDGYFFATDELYDMVPHWIHVLIVSLNINNQR